MGFKSRLDRLEAMQPVVPWEPPIFFHSVVEPSENGPQEIGAFARLFIDGQFITVWRAEKETQNAFELRVRDIKAEELAGSRHSTNSISQR